MHIVPQLRKLEHKYLNELVIIGVEAGKFAAERETHNIRQAALRLEIDHPVVNDSHFLTWRAYAVSAWPTLVVVDPDGYVLGTRPGEITFESFDPVIAGIIANAAAQGKLDRSPLPFLRPERLAEPARPLAFPGKVLAANGRLFAADSNHNRILQIALAPDGFSGSVEAIAGSGSIGFQDGDYASTTFHHPQGMALDGDTLYVADAENHAIRALDTRRQRVTTVAGTGRQASNFELGGQALAVSLSSPWDVAVHDGSLYIAQAGTHQLWRLDLVAGELRPYAGSGGEAIVDADLGNSALAQPMGLAVADRLYFADSESSAIRSAGLPPLDDVRTIVGEGLFEYGDRDGPGQKVRLQHPQGVCYHDGSLYVADTYNNKIKRLDPASGQVDTLFGDLAGYHDGDRPLFDEPGGLSASGHLLYIADTNNHAIRVADLTTGVVSTLDLQSAPGA